MTINTVVITITDKETGSYTKPAYEVHSFERAMEVIESTKSLLAEQGKTDTHELYWEVSGRA
jgi:hypothetical protein